MSPTPTPPPTPKQNITSMTPAAMARLPGELILSILKDNFPSRQSQIRTLATLIDVSFMIMDPAGTVLLQEPCLVLILLSAKRRPMSELSCPWH